MVRLCSTPQLFLGVNMIEIENLTRDFGSRRVIDHLSFSVGEGEILGFLGPNGAGKSTTMKMLTGFLRPTSGTIRICGHNIETDGLVSRKLIGYLPEGAPGYGEMKVLDYLEFLADIRELSGSKRAEAIDRVVHDVELQDVLAQTIDTLSKGFRRRVGLAQAMLHNPKILVLDEPTDGLDPNQKHQIRQLIRNLGREKIVIISTHLLEEVDAVCSRVVIIHQGKKVADETPGGLLEKYHGFRLDEIFRKLTMGISA